MGVWLFAVCSDGSAQDFGDDAPRPQPREAVNYIVWFNEHRTKASNENATTAYASAIARLQPMGDARLLTQASVGPWGDLPEVQSWLSGNDRALKMFAKASMMAECSLGLRAGVAVAGGSSWEHSLLGSVVPGLGAFAVAADGLLARGWQRWSAGEETELVADALACLRMSHHLLQGVPIVSRVAGLSVARRGYQSLLAALALASNPDEFAESLSSRLSEADPALAPMTEVLAWMRLTAWDVLQRMYEPGEAPGRWGVDESSAEVYEYLVEQAGIQSAGWGQVRASALASGFEASLRAVDEFYDGLVGCSARPYHLVAEEIDRISLSSEAMENLMLRGLLANVTELLRTHAHVQAVRRGTHLAVGVFAFRSRNNRFPETLDELGDGPELASIRVDPYTGRDFVYARTRTSFVLYSVGSDIKDDGGRPFLPRSERGDLVIWPVRR